MVVFGGGGGPPPGLKPHLGVRLKPGWTYHAGKRRFVSEASGEVVPGEDLPPGSKIVAVAPKLAGAARGSLSPDEEKLARHLQVILPAGTDPGEILPRVRRWKCVEKAELPPEVSLPGGPAGHAPAAGPGRDRGRR